MGGHKVPRPRPAGKSREGSLHPSPPDRRAPAAFSIQQMPPPALALPDRDAIVERLRTSLMVHTPGSGYRHDSPPSSAASSCTLDPDEDMFDDTDDTPLEGPASLEWEAWLDWDRAVSGMRVED